MLGVLEVLKNKSKKFNSDNMSLRLGPGEIGYCVRTALSLPRKRLMDEAEQPHGLQTKIYSDKNSPSEDEDVSIEIVMSPAILLDIKKAEQLISPDGPRLPSLRHASQCASVRQTKTKYAFEV